MKNAQEIHQYILNIENNYPVNEWKVNNVMIWPFIRVKLAADLNFANNKNFARKSQSFKAQNSDSKLKRLKTSLGKYKKLKQSDFVFTSTYAHRAYFKGKQWNKFYDPIIEEAKLTSFTVIEHNTKTYYNNIKEVKNHENLYFFEDFHYSTDVIQSKLKRIKKIIKQLSLSGYKDLYQQLLSDGLLGDRVKNYTEHNLLKQVERLFLMVKTYKKLLKKLKPKAVFEVCYYSMNSMALNIAAKDLNIPAVEFQHGPQPELHSGYSNWSKINNQGYDILPKTFWEWDKASIKTLNKWLINQKNHLAIVNGNPWLSYFKKFKEKTTNKTILYSLQPFSNDMLFPEFVLNFIKTNSYKWVLRVHPTDFNRIDEIEQFLKSQNVLEKVELSGKNQQPLPLQLMESFLHLTNSSGTAIEAADLGIKTIFIDPLAKDYFSDLIQSERGYFSDGDNFSELVSQIKEQSSLNKEELKSPKQMFDDLVELLKIK